MSNPIIIQANEEGQKAVKSLCDVALKVAGLQNFIPVSQILSALKPIPPQGKEPADPPRPKDGIKEAG
jgi:hypothetical protein